MEREDRDHSSSSAVKAQASSNCDPPGQNPPRLAAALLRLPYREYWLVQGNTPRSLLATPGARGHVGHSRFGEQLHHDQKLLPRQKNDSVVLGQNDKRAPESCPQRKCRDRVEWFALPCATIPA